MCETLRLTGVGFDVIYHLYKIRIVLQMEKSFNPNDYSRAELKKIADGIYKELGINHINLQVELSEHYRRCNEAADLAYKALEDGNATAGTAAVLTATTGALKELARLEIDLRNADSLKLFEQAVIETLRQMDDPERCIRILNNEMQRVGYDAAY